MGSYDFIYTDGSLESPTEYGDDKGNIVRLLNEKFDKHSILSYDYLKPIYYQYQCEK